MRYIHALHVIPSFTAKLNSVRMPSIATRDCLSMKYWAFIIFFGFTVIGQVHTIETLSSAGPAPVALNPSLNETSESLRKLAALNKSLQFNQAFTLAQNLVEGHEGDTEFDFQYGIAAIETRHYDQALFAFERLVLNEKNQPRYRLELARTHFYLRNLERSEIEFNRVLKNNPPKEVKEHIYIYLLRLNDLKKSVEPRFAVSLDVSAGFDSNINSAPHNGFLPKEELVFINDVQLESDSRETQSSYWGTLFNFNNLRPLTKRSSVDIQLLASNKANTKLNQYNLIIGLVDVGYNYYMNNIHLRGAGRYKMVGLNGEPFLDTASLDVQLYYSAKNKIKYGLSTSLGLTVYDGNNTGDLNQKYVSISIFGPVKKHSWSVILLAGQDTAVKEINDFNSVKYQGISLQSTHFSGNRISYYSTLNLLKRKHDKINRALYSKLRVDTLLTVMAGWRYSYNSQISFKNDYSVSHADSTLVANTYQRNKVEFGSSYRF